MLAAVLAVHRVQCEVMADLIWTEIDDASHLARARDLIYPRLSTSLP